MGSTLSTLGCLKRNELDYIAESEKSTDNRDQEGYHKFIESLKLSIIYVDIQKVSDHFYDTFLRQERLMRRWSTIQMAKIKIMPLDQRRKIMWPHLKLMIRK